MEYDYKVTEYNADGAEVRRHRFDEDKEWDLSGIDTTASAIAGAIATQWQPQSADAAAWRVEVRVGIEDGEAWDPATRARPGEQATHDNGREALAAVESVLGGVLVEIRTAGELAALMARLPADIPISVANHSRIDADLDLDQVEDRTAAVAMAIPVLVPDSTSRRGRRTVAGVELGAILLAKDASVSGRSRAVCPYDQTVEAKHVGSVAGVFAGHNEMLDFIADNLEGEAEYLLHEWVDGEELREQMRIEGRRLRHAIDRLTALGTRVNAHLTGNDQGGEQR